MNQGCTWLKIEKSSLVYVNQDEPLGYGHAVYLSKSFVGEDKILLHAGDTMALSKEHNIEELIELFTKSGFKIRLFKHDSSVRKSFNIGGNIFATKNK